MAHRNQPLRRSCTKRYHSTTAYEARRRPSAVRASSASGAQLPAALLFDCDGVLVETERDGHRPAFNKAFQEMGIDAVWDVDEYGELLKVGGGKERMTAYWNKVGWPESIGGDPEKQQETVKALHKLKTEIFVGMIEAGDLPLRPGIEPLVKEAVESGVTVAVCSTSNERAVTAVVRELLPEYFDKFTVFAGDVVPKKKPSPDIYLLASKELGIPADKCAVVEDSHIGCTAAKEAGMTCFVTKSVYTEDEDFSRADAIFGEATQFTVADMGAKVYA